MTVFKTFLKVLNKCKAPIIMYTVFLVFFGAFNMKTSDNSTNFVSSKPDILIINHDENKGITKNLVDYIRQNSNIVKVKENEDAINDALFYRDVNYIIYIPSHFRTDFLEHKNPKIEVKSTGDYQASFASMILERYMKVANLYNEVVDTEEELIQKIDESLTPVVAVEITSKVDHQNLDKAAFYYNFTNYCLLAGCIYMICLVLSIFKSDKIQKRTMISSIHYKTYNRQLLLSNSLFAIILWLIYVLLSFILLGSIMFTTYGLFYILNSFIFTFCTLTIAFLLGNVIKNKNIINGIVNVIALGSSFLCGAFVPMQYLPDIVLKIAHILPSYWYIKTNELIKEIEVFNLITVKPIFINMMVLILFSVCFIVVTNIISKVQSRKVV